MTLKFKCADVVCIIYNTLDKLVYFTSFHTQWFQLGVIECNWLQLNPVIKLIN